MSVLSIFPCFNKILCPPVTLNRLLFSIRSFISRWYCCDVNENLKINNIIIVIFAVPQGIVLVPLLFSCTIECVILSRFFFKCLPLHISMKSGVPQGSILVPKYQLMWLFSASSESAAQWWSWEAQ